MSKCQNVKRSELKKIYFNNNKFGYTYFMKASGFNYIKIGASKNPDNRKLQLEKEYPFKLNIIKRIKSSNNFGLENKFHDIYSEERMNGEWFNLTDKQILEIINFTKESIVDLLYQRHLKDNVPRKTKYKKLENIVNDLQVKAEYGHNAKLKPNEILDILILKYEKLLDYDDIHSIYGNVSKGTIEGLCHASSRKEITKPYMAALIKDKGDMYAFQARSRSNYNIT